MATSNNVDDFINELRTIIQYLPVLSSSEFNKYNKYKISRVKDFREYLFKEEIDRISELLSNLSPGRVSILRESISDFDRIRSEIRYVSKSLFKNNFANAINEALKSDDKDYALIVRNAYKMFQSKLEVVKGFKKGSDTSDLSGVTYLGLFTASFIISFILNFMNKEIDVNEARRIIDTFMYDFIISYVFVSTRSHIVFEIPIKRSSVKSVRELLNSLLRLYNESGELRERYQYARKYLGSEKFPFDLKYPVVRSRKIFEKEWISLIIIAFKKGDRRILLKIDPDRGFKAETYFPASPLYFELAVSKDKDKLLIMANISPSHKWMERIAKLIFSKILSINIGSTSFSKYLESLGAICYEISSATLVKELRQILEGSPSKIEKKLKSFESRLKRGMNKALDRLPLTYKDRLKDIVSTLRLAGVILEYKLGEHRILSISSELSPFIEQAYIAVNLDEVYSLIARLIRTKTEIHKYIENLVESQDRIKGSVSLVFTCKLNQERPVEIIITNEGNVLFFNMNREIITELSRLFQEVVEKWSKRK